MNTLHEVLHKIVDHRNIIFGAGNHELDFFGSLTFCLLRISATKNIPLEPEGKCFNPVKGSFIFIRLDQKSRLPKNAKKQA